MSGDTKVFCLNEAKLKFNQAPWCYKRPNEIRCFVLFTSDGDGVCQRFIEHLSFLREIPLLVSQSCEFSMRILGSNSLKLSSCFRWKKHNNDTESQLLSNDKGEIHLLMFISNQAQASLVPLYRKEYIQCCKQTKRAFMWCEEKLLCMKLKIVIWWRLMVRCRRLSDGYVCVSGCARLDFLFSVFCFVSLRRCRPFNSFFHFVVTFSTIAFVSRRVESIFIDFSSQKLKDKSPTQYEKTHLLLEILFLQLSNVRLP